MPIIGTIASSTRQGQATDTGAMFPLQVVTVGSAGASSVTFSNIPNTYTHLQLRLFLRTNRSTYNIDVAYIRPNSDTTASNYASSQLRANQGNFNNTVSATEGVNTWGDFLIGANNGSAPFAGLVVDFLDYANTNKFKTARGFGGADSNGDVASFCTVPQITSQLWRSTNAISSILLTPAYGTSFNQGSSFALYGIKGA